MHTYPRPLPPSHYCGHDRAISILMVPKTSVNLEVWFLNLRYTSLHGAAALTDRLAATRGGVLGQALLPGTCATATF